MTSWEFPCSGPVDVDVSTATGSVTITAAPTELVTVAVPAGADSDPADELRVDFAEGRLKVAEPARRGLFIRHRDIHLAIGVPPGSTCTVRTATASIRCHGELGALDAHTSAGSVKADAVLGPVEVNAMAGTARLGYITGDVTATSASGDLELGHVAGDVTIRTVSGNIEIVDAQASVAARTASGRVRIASMTRGRADVNTVSGDVEIKVAPGTGVYLDLAAVAGRMSSELDSSDQQDGHADLHLTCRTVSGNVRIAKASHADVAG